MIGANNADSSIGAALVVLAGGASARMGQPKALLPFQGRTWLDAQLEGFARAGGRDAIVVVSALDRMRTALAWIDDALAREVIADGLSVRAVHQPRPEEGPFSSLVLGLSALRERAAFVLPIDVPVCAGTWHALAGALGDADAVVPAHHGRRGHPVLVSASFAARLSAIPIDAPDARLDRQLARADRVEVSVDDPTVLLDLDTPEEWAAWIASQAASHCYPAAQ
jgi:molybdenum cofactor cytidylyltransferase